MQLRANCAEPQCYLGLDEPGGPACLLLFMCITGNGLQRLMANAVSRTGAKEALDGPASPERILGASCREAAQSNKPLQATREGRSSSASRFTGCGFACLSSGH